MTPEKAKRTSKLVRRNFLVVHQNCFLSKWFSFLWMSATFPLIRRQKAFCFQDKCWTVNKIHPNIKALPLDGVSFVCTLSLFNSIELICFHFLVHQMKSHNYLYQMEMFWKQKDNKLQLSDAVETPAYLDVTAIPSCLDAKTKSNHYLLVHNVSFFQFFLLLWFAMLGKISGSDQLH